VIGKIDLVCLRQLPGKELIVRGLSDTVGSAWRWPKSQARSELVIDVLLREIIDEAVVTLEGARAQDERIAALARFEPDAIPIIESVIQGVAMKGSSTAAFENAGLLCEAIGKIGGQRAYEILSRLATQPSNIAEYRYIRASAEKGLAHLGKSLPKAETGKYPARSAIPPLLDAGQAQAKAGECLAAVESFLRAVEIEPEFMMGSLAWQHIGSVFTGVHPPVWGKQWIRIPKGWIPDGVLSRLSRLPNQSRLPGYPGPYVEPPTEAEIVALISDLRSILKRYAGRPEARHMANDSFDDINELQSDNIDKLKIIMLEDSDQARRMAALEKFISGTEPVEVMVLSEIACRSADPSVRARAIERLRERGNKPRARLLISLWLDPAKAEESWIKPLNAEERMWAAETLAKILA
jgi:hypothetical protein